MSTIGKEGKPHPIPIWLPTGLERRPEPYITIVIPTIEERAHWLSKCRTSYHMTTGAVRTEVITIRDAPTCATAWNEGIAQAKGYFIHLTADDIEAHPGWWDAAQRCEGYVPAPLILNTDGSLQSCGGAGMQPDGSPTEMSRIPWATRELFQKIGPFPEDLHYYTDNWFSWAARKHGFESRVCHGYKFTHHLAPERREMADERLASDGAKFQQLTRRG